MAGENASASLVGTARKGFLWQAAAFVLSRLALLASTIVLARILGPSEYGMISLALIVVLALNVIADLGVSQAIVYLPRSARRIDAALGTALLGSTTLALLWVAVAPSVASWLDHPEAARMMQVLALVLVFTSLGQVPDAVLRKELRFSRRLPGELSRGLVRGGLAIALAFAGYGAWSLVWAEIVGSLVYATVGFLMLGHRPTHPLAWLSRERMRQLLSFGLPTAANGGLNTAVVNLDYLIVAGALGSTSLGLYFVGFRLPELLVISVFQVFSQVAYPMYTRVKDDPERLRRAILLSLRIQATYGLTVGAGMAAAAPILVPVVFGSQYADSVRVMQAIAIYTVFMSLAVGEVDVFKATGRPQLGAFMAFCRMVVLLPSLLVAARWGIMGVAVAQALVALTFTVAAQWLLVRVTTVRFRDLIRVLIPAGTIGLAAGAGVALGDLLWSGEGWLALMFVAVTGALMGGAALLLVDRGLVVEVLRR